MPNLNTPEAAEYLLATHGIKRHAQSLRNLRQFGGGPAYLRDLATGAVLYASEALDEWAGQILRPATCTAEERGIARAGRPPVEARGSIGTPALAQEPRRRRRVPPADAA